MKYKLYQAISSIRELVNLALSNVYSKGIENVSDLPEFEIEIPSDSSHGDLSTNVAMIYARIFKCPPRAFAESLRESLIMYYKESDAYIKKIEIAGPGFINFFLEDEFFSDVLREVKHFGADYGTLDYGQGRKVMVEFVSANPTGPMHIGNARGGALGDCLASVLEKAGYDVRREFYVNDAGNQIEKFAVSLDVRYQQICNGEDYIAMPENGYQGQDIKDLASEFYDIYKDDYMFCDEKLRKDALVSFALPKNISRMQADLEKYKIFYDKWFYESELYRTGEVEKIINAFNKNGYTYSKDGCLWYKATKFGAEKDEVLVRSNGIPTYYAADIAYHFNKFVTRDFDVCIDIWGADHHGHVERMKGAMEALGIDQNRLKIILVQLVRLMRGREVVRMSKRTGKAIQLSDLIDEVGADSAKFMFNNSEANCGMDFDLDLAVKQDSQNPVYYVQYAYARICSVFRQLSLQQRQFDEYKATEPDYSVLKSEYEKKLIYFIAQYPGEILRSSKSFDPTKITHYVINLATLFHKFYSSCKIISNDTNLTFARLGLCECVKIVIKSVLDMFKIESPESMAVNN